jgi:hypothetical protein
MWTSHGDLFQHVTHGACCSVVATSTASAVGAGGNVYIRNTHCVVNSDTVSDRLCWDPAMLCPAGRQCAAEIVKAAPAIKRVAQELSAARS